MIEALNDIAGDWSNYLWTATWQSTLVALALLALVKVARRMPSSLRYGLLLVALVKFAIPPHIAAPTGVFTHIAPAVQVAPPEASQASEAALVGATGSLPASAVLQPPRSDETTLAALAAEFHAAPLEGGEAGFPPAPAAASAAHAPPAPAATLVRPTLASLLLLAHVAGTLAVLVWIGLGILDLTRRVRQGRLIDCGPTFDHFRDLAAQLGLRRRIRLVACTEPGTPMALGVLRPAVLIPQNMLEQLPAERLRAILAHELGHHRRHDLLVNYFQLLVTALWWFNPVVWLLNRALRAAREDCCDDLLLGKELVSSETYSQTLVVAAASLPPQVAIGTSLGFAQQLHPLGRRLRRIMDQTLPRPARPSLAVLLLVALVAAVALPGLRRESVLAQLEDEPAPAAAPNASEQESGAQDAGVPEVHPPEPVPVAAQSFTLTYRPFEQPVQGLRLRPGYQELVTQQPLELTEVPRNANPQPWYGEVMLGRQVVMDTDERGEKWDVLYVDRDGDGMLSEDEAVRPDPAGAEGERPRTFADIDLEVGANADAGAVRLPAVQTRRLRISWNRGRKFAQMSWMHLGCFTGEVDFGDRRVTLNVYDGNSNGLFNDTADANRTPDYIVLHINNDGGDDRNVHQIVPVGERVELDGQAWDVSVAADGSSVTVKPAAGATVEASGPGPAAGEASGGGQWRLAFSDDFERDDIGPEWHVMKGHWRVKDGSLYCSAPFHTSKSIVSVRDFGENQRLEFDAMSEEPCDLTGLLNVSSADFTGGLFFGFASENNGFSKMLVEREMVKKIEATAQPGKWHQIVCERDGDRLSMSVDGQVVAEHTLQRPYHAGSRQKAGFYIFNNGYIDNVRIYTKTQP